VTKKKTVTRLFPLAPRHEICSAEKKPKRVTREQSKKKRLLRAVKRVILSPERTSKPFSEQRRSHSIILPPRGLRGLYRDNN
jgi:hypothetical protein